MESVLNNPYLHGNVTRMKMILPVGKKKARKMIATSKGITSWFPRECKGRVSAGNFLSFQWPDGKHRRSQVLSLGERHSSLQMQWRNGGRLRYYLHGKLTTLTLEVEYPRSSGGHRQQISEIAQWSFLLANLKSVALGGPDLRNSLSNHSWNRGFID